MKQFVFNFMAFPMLLLVFVGCSPDVNAVRSMSEETRLDIAGENYLELLEWFSEQNDPIWRAEAINTLVTLDKRLDSSIQDPASHESVIRLLKEEYTHPKVTDLASSQDIYLVKAWAIHGLGKLQDPSLAGFMVSVLESNSERTDPQFQIRASALNALSRDMRGLALAKPLRNRILRQLPSIEYELRRRNLQGNLEVLIEEINRYCKGNLKTYGGIVEVLPESLSEASDSKVVLKLLEWNYQKLSAGMHFKSDLSLFRANIQKLLILAWSPNNNIRTHSRIILAEFAPLSLYRQLVSTLENGKGNLQRDSILLANLLPDADDAASWDLSQRRIVAANAESKEAGFDIKEYPPLRTRAQLCLDRKITNISTDSREIIYARLLAHDPDSLADHQTNIASAALKEPEERNLQQLRYLGRLLSKDTPLLTAQKRDEIVRLIGGYMQKKSLPVRKQVVAHLLKPKPSALALSIASLLGDIGSENSAGASYLLNAYLMSLQRIEDLAEQGKKTSYPKELLSQFGNHPYNLLANVLKRPEMKLNDSVVYFLDTRDPNNLLDMYSDYISLELFHKRTPKLKEFAVLGDMMISHRSKLSKAVIAKTEKVIRLGMRTENKEQSLLCCRYLLELGFTVPAKQHESLPLPVQVMLQLASQDNGKEATQ